MTQTFDVIVLGAGPGGQIAATRAAQLGFKTACVDDWKGPDGGPAPGGTCTNIGCIPAKALLQSSEYYELVEKHVAEHGLGVQGLTMDIARMQARKDSVVKRNGSGILYLFRKNKITFLHGHATFTKAIPEGGYELQVTGAVNDTISAPHIIIATGSDARPLPQAPFDEVNILSNDGGLKLDSPPRRLGIIGAGVVGLELGSVWRRLGSEVTILEGLPTFLASVDEDIAKEARKALEKQGLKFELGVKVGDIATSSSGVNVAYTDAAGQAKTLECDKLIASIGRIPNTRGLGAEAIGLQLDGRGNVAVDHDCRSNLPGIWAIGDVVRGPMLAHKAEEEGSAVAERIAGQLPEVNFNTVPWVIYTSPEIAWVGQTSQQLRAEGRAFKIGTFPFLANGRARAIGNTTGLVKVVADATTDQLLGVHILGLSAGELIGEAVAAMEFGAASEDIAMICHAHPTLSEALKEAALDANGRVLNF